MTSDQAFARLQMHRLNQELLRHKSLLVRLEAARSAVGNSNDDSLERMIDRAHGELNHISAAIGSITQPDRSAG